MTRFKELERINKAIEHKNKQELLWSLKYCQNRLSLSTIKEHKKHWNKLIKKINSTIKLLNE